MNYRSLFSLLGSLLILTSSFLLIFALLGFFLYPHDKQGLSFLVSCLIALALGFLFRINGTSSISMRLTYREGFAIASLGWILVAFVGALPFYFSGVIPSFVDAYFESVSGFTTTGASILTDIEGIGQVMLLWRSFSQWLGGMGIIVLTLAIIPTLSTGGMQLFVAEVSGPAPDKIAPRVGQTAKNLYLTYVAFTLLQVILLSAGGMSLFESLCHAFSTISTGGFSPLNSSMTSYYGHRYDANFLYYEIVVAIFMFLAGVNFSLHYHFFTGNFKSYLRSIELRHYMGITLTLMILVGIDLITHGTYTGFLETFRHTFFTVISMLTGTGFSTEDFGVWPSTSRSLILTMMFCGGMAGSTTGGVKIIRIAAMMKEAFAGIKHTIHPKRVFTIRFGSDHLSREVTAAINAFMVLYIIIYVTGVILLSYTNLDIESIASMSIACLGNVGPGLGEVGPTKNFASLPDYAKWVLNLFMLLGRLELLPIIVLFLPKMWAK